MHKLDEKALAAARRTWPKVGELYTFDHALRKAIRAYLASLPSPEQSAAQQPATEADEGWSYLKQVKQDLQRAISETPDEFPNCADWPITLPAGHWRELAPALSQSPAKPAGGSTKRPAAEEKRP